MAIYFGDDTSNNIDGGIEDDFIYGYGDDDFLDGNGGKDFIVGGDGNDTLDGGDGDDSLFGGDDSDLFFGDEGADLLSGGDGRDMATYSSELVTGITINLSTQEGHGGIAEGDVLLSIEDVVGTNFADNLIGSNVANAFYAGGGNDYAEGLGGDDFIFGNTGDDQIVGGTGADTLDGGGDIDTLSYYSSAAGVTVSLAVNLAQFGDAQGDVISNFENLVGSNFDDNLYGSDVANVISGYDGNDEITGGAGADTINGGAGVDRLVYWGSPTGVSVDLNAGTGFLGDAAGDIITGIENLDGSNWADTLQGNGGVNVLRGSGGNDILNGRGGADQMHGGLDHDTYYVDNASDKVFENAGAGTDTVFTTVSFALAAGQEVENLYAADAASLAPISLTGNATAQTIRANAGANTINGGGGADTMQGLGGDDMYYVDNAADVVTDLAGGGAADRVLTSVSYTLTAGSHVELFSTTNLAGVAPINLTGNGFGQAIAGNAGANIIDGGGGVDAMQGFGGDDWYYVDNVADSVTEAAGGGTDRVLTNTTYSLTAGSHVELFSTTNLAGVAAINLTGNAFGQAIAGNAGANFINGLAGNDSLAGFGGSDTFVFNTALNAATNLDTITDFSHADDTFYLDNGIFAQLGANGPMNAAFFHAGAAAADANDFIVYNQATGALFYDANGNGAGGAVQFATLSTKPALLADDFIVF